MRVRPWVTLGVALSLALAGCSGSGAAATTAPSAGAPSPGVSSAPPAKVIVVATPRPRSAAPALKITGTAWPAILTSLTGYGQWVLANPDPARATMITTPGCAMFDLLSQQASALLRDKAYLKPSPVVFGPVTGPSLAPGTPVTALYGRVTLNVTVSRPGEPVLSRAGARQISQFDPLPPTDLRITLAQGTDGGWRLCTAYAWSDSGEPDDPSVSLF